MNLSDTIAAISSAVGNSARIIVRMSGDESVQLAGKVCTGDVLSTSGASLSRLQFHGLSFRAWVYVFVAPHSATGQDVVEFHIPGNPLLARLLLDFLIEHGARSAEPGEFTARAFFNGRIGLTEAEGVAATIAANSQAELDAARRLMSGELARRLTPLADALVNTLALVEVGIDFSDEDVTFLARDEIVRRVNSAMDDLRRLIAESPRLERLAHEPQIVLAGRPNAGKSTLLNVLAGHERAVVSHVEGTTRDAIWSHIHLRRGIVRITDIAGIDDIQNVASSKSISIAPNVQRVIESKMRAVALRTIASADLVVLVCDATDARELIDMSRAPDLVVYTKSDLLAAPAAAMQGSVHVSAHTQAGLPQLLDRLDALAFGRNRGGAGLSLNARHVRAIGDAVAALDRAAACVDAGAELVAAELREAIEAIGGVLGQITPDDVLGQIFSAFCIGK